LLVLFLGKWLKNDEETLEANKVIEGNPIHLIINKRKNYFNIFIDGVPLSVLILIKQLLMRQLPPLINPQISLALLMLLALFLQIFQQDKEILLQD